MILGSKRHTAGDTTKWTIDYSQWLDNTAAIVSAVVTSSSTTCTVSGQPTVLGKVIEFLLTGGQVNEKLTISITMTDTLSNVKKDTVAFTVVEP